MRLTILCVAAMVAIAVIVAAIEGGGQAAHPAVRRAAAPALLPIAALYEPANQVAHLGRGESLVAEAKHRWVTVYRRAHGKRKLRLRNPNVDGAPLVFLVRSTRMRWIRVYLPVRPNGSSGWIKASAVTLARDPYRVRVNLTRHRLTLLKRGKRVRRIRIGVGRAVTPTPAGTYFVTELLRQPNPRGLYGPYAFGLSAHSNVLHEFAGAAAEVGIHGTNFPRGIGNDVSHGCIRVSNANITRLAKMLPLGTPVVIRR